MDFSLPRNILYIISTINDSGYKAHVVGGCVRDTLANRVPYDWDITTNASPEIIKSLFKRTYDTGIRHGTVTVILDDLPYEITTWRKESGYSDHRRPDHVYSADSLTEDLARRDFTMNAIAYHPQEGLVDPFGGFNDINDRIIRCVGNPYERFSEDALRMLRAVRFSAQLDFTIEKDTHAAISSLSADLSHISNERIQSELNKILESPTPEKLSLLWETGLYRAIFPCIENLPSLWQALIKHFLESLNKKSILLALLFYISIDTGKQAKSGKLLNNLKYDNDTIRIVTTYLKCLESFGPPSQRNLRKSFTEFGTEVAGNCYKALNLIKTYENNCAKCLINELPDPSPLVISISGADLKNIGFKGREIKDMLSLLSLCIYEKPELNDYDTLMILVNAISPMWC